MASFDKFSQQLKSLFTDQQIANIKRAYLVAEKAHLNQKRSSGEPYITHPLAVAAIIAEMHLDEATLIAALLHDVVEDTGLSKETIAEQFGQMVADLVDGVSKLTNIPFENRAQAQADNFRKMLLAMAKDIRVIFIKLADRLHNMSTLASLPAEKRERIAKETLDIYVPIAKRLGMYGICVALEDLAFETLHPYRHHVIGKAVKSLMGRRQDIFSQIQTALQETLGAHSFAEPAVVGREKHLYGIYEKMRRKHVSLASIMDVYGFRIIVSSLDECYSALGVIHNLYKPLAGRFKDYIAIPKANGYQSLHTTLLGPHSTPIEMQIRTRDMDNIATKGMAAHWLYKASTRGQEVPLWLQNIVELEHSEHSSLEFIEHLKADLTPGSIYVFTPEGEITELPRQATVIDFAYAVHSDVGDQCVGARVNRHLVPVETKLHSGDSIEIMTDPSVHPKPTWLKFVTTSKARNRIRDFLKKQRSEQAIASGEQLLHEALRSLCAEPSTVLHKQISPVFDKLSVANLKDLYYEIGTGNYNPFLMAQYLLSDPSQQTSHFTVSKELTLRGAENLPLSFANCCYPLPYDDIVGCLNPGKGLTVHTKGCGQIKMLSKNFEKFLPLEWEHGITALFPTEIRIVMRNTQGALASLSAQFVSLNLNIQDLKFLSNTQEAGKLKFVFDVENRQHLTEIMSALKTNPYVLQISRKTSNSGKPSFSA